MIRNIIFEISLKESSYFVHLPNAANHFEYFLTLTRTKKSRFIQKQFMIVEITTFNTGLVVAKLNSDENIFLTKGSRLGIWRSKGGNEKEIEFKSYGKHELKSFWQPHIKTTPLHSLSLSHKHTHTPSHTNSTTHTSTHPHTQNNTMNC